MKDFSACEYTLTKQGLINPRFRGVPGWESREKILTKRFCGNRRQRLKKLKKFVNDALDAHESQR